MSKKTKPVVITEELVAYFRKDMEERVETMYHPNIVSQSRVTENRYHLAITLMLAILERHIGETDENPDVKDAIFFMGLVTDNRCEFCWVEHKPGKKCKNPRCPG